DCRRAGRYRSAGPAMASWRRGCQAKSHKDNIFWRGPVKTWFAFSCVGRHAILGRGSREGTMTDWTRSLALLAALFIVAPAAAQTYPMRPITIVVPATPGGVTDVLGRMLARHLSEAWGQQVIVENKPGANNQLAAELTAKAAPDGYTLFIAPEVTFVVNPSIYPRLDYDPVKDFTPISGLVIINHALIVHPSVPATNVNELIALAKARPGELNYGTYGLGSTGHLNMAMLETLAGVKLVPVHYKGAAPALTDVVAGHIQMMF